MKELSVELQPEASSRTPSYVGTLSGWGERDEPRQVRGASCAEVAEALTFIAALAVEQAAAREAALTTSPAAASAAPASAALRSAGTAAPSATPPGEDAGSPELTPARPRPRRWGLGAFTSFGNLAASGLGFDVGLAGALRSDGAALVRWLSLGVYAGRETVRVPGTRARARFQRLALQATVCPWEWAPAPRVGVRACAQGDLGVLRGEGLSVDGAQTDSVPWASAGAELRTFWAPAPALELGAMLGAAMPLTRPRFYFLPQITALEIPVVGVRGSLTTSVYF